MTEEDAAISNHFPPSENIDVAPFTQNKDQFRLFLEASPDHFRILRSIQNADEGITDLSIGYTNPATARSINYTQEELIGQRLLQLFPNCKTNGVFAHYITVAKTDDSQTFETLYRNKNLTGWFRHVVVSLNGNTVVSFSDITERKRAEEEREQTELASRQQEQHFKIALQTAKLGFWKNDLIKGIFTCSLFAERSCLCFDVVE